MAKSEKYGWILLAGPLARTNAVQHKEDLKVPFKSDDTPLPLQWVQYVRCIVRGMENALSMPTL